MVSAPALAAHARASGRTTRLKSAVTELLHEADITIDGTRPQDLQVHDDRFYGRFLRGGRLALGESYMDGWWDCERIDELYLHLFRSRVAMQTQAKTWRFALPLLYAKLFPENSRRRSREVIDGHYDLGNELFECTLDRHMVYTAPLLLPGLSLEEAQEAKLDLICRKLQLKPGMRVLDIGSGWGSFCKFAASRYGVRVLGISISAEQNRWAQKNCAGLPVEIQFLDYREIATLGRFDRIVCLEMIEHVGVNFYRTYFETVASCLADDGLFALQASVTNASGFFNPWLTKYIFPGGYVPSFAELSAAMENLFFFEHVQNIGPYYYQTFLTWFANFERNWPKIRERYDARFFRMWKYFLLSCAAGFETRDIQVQQMVLAKKGHAGAYHY